MSAIFEENMNDLEKFEALFKDIGIPYTVTTKKYAAYSKKRQILIGSEVISSPWEISIDFTPDGVFSVFDDYRDWDE